MRVRVEFNIKGQKPKRINILLSEAFDDASMRRETKREINKRFKIERDACHGNYTITRRNE